MNTGAADTDPICGSLTGPMRYDADFVPAQRSLAEPYRFGCYEAALRSWIATVAIVEVGYVGESEEYAVELSARD